jgi:hypothetical protein
MTNIEKLRSLIKEGFREYDGDIMEDAINLIDTIKKDQDAIFALSCKQQKQIEWFNSSKTLTHGTGEISYFIHPGSAIVWQELMNAINNAVATTPLPIIIDSINKTSSRL